MTAWLVGNMAWASLAMLLVLALRRPFAQAFGAGPAYALWLVPLLRLLLPSIALPGAVTVLPPLDFVVQAGALASPQSPTFAWIGVLLALWLAGVSGFLAWQFLAYRAFLARLSANVRGLGAHAGLPLVESPAVQGPLALGLIDRRIVVPTGFADRYSATERRLALDHEAVHHRRGDIWWNLAALAVLALNWFNPIAWLAFRAFREDQELACDAAVAAGAAAGEREAYARALVKSASRPGLVAVCPLNRADQLKRRLKMMKTHRRSKGRMLAGAAAVLTLGSVGLALGSPGAAHPHPEGGEQGREHRIIILERNGEGDQAEHRESAMTRFTLHRGESGEIELPEDCREGDELVNVDERNGDQRTRFILCTRGEDTPAARAATLETARNRVAESEHMSEEQRARIVARLDEEIARLRAQ